jgi:hypothetical protein
VGRCPVPCRSSRAHAWVGTGRVCLMDVSQNTTTLYQVSTDEDGYFYHMAEWYDMDGDGAWASYRHTRRPLSRSVVVLLTDMCTTGKLDLLTAKATLPTDGRPPGGKLVWLQNPGSPQGPWPERVLMEGPDVFFRIADLDGGTRP